ncbi:GntR family transcriptional regulator [uncultured Salegentibacter sp.]|jgi:GntR family transcriptional regulator|uniref:GntR family transcriptional regulator n=1 Tax=uncultured Salegentibacter sp. TaxID=259320 RepID=UPI0030D7F36D
MSSDKTQKEIKFELDHSSGLPLHYQVEQLIREVIQAPEYQEGKLLPKEVDLAKMLGISRNTVRQATNRLEHENLLVRKKGVGTRAVREAVSTKLNNWTSFSEEMHNKGVQFVNYHTKVSWEKASKVVAGMLQIEDNKEVLRLERLRGLDNGPFVRFISYFHPRIGLTGKEDFSRHLYDILEQDYASVPSVSKERINAITANKEQAKYLGVEVGSPLLLRKRLVCDPGDRPIEYNIGYYRADSFTYEIDIIR